MASRFFFRTVRGAGVSGWVFLAFLTACGQDRPKPAAVLQATPEAVVLIRDNEARCAKIGQDGIQRLAEAEAQAELDVRAVSSLSQRPAPGDLPEEAPKPPIQPSEVFKKYLAEDAAEELAAVDEAQMAIQELLPAVKTEVPPEVATAIAALSGAHDQVCLSIRQPRRSVQYRGTLDFAETAYRNAEEKLLPLYAVSATDAQFALHKYGPRLDAARAGVRERNRQAPVIPAKDYERDQREWQASQQVQTQEQIEHETALKKWYGKRDDTPQESMPKLGVVAKPTPSPEERAQAMKTWHAGYSAKAGTVKSALAAYLRLRKEGTADPAVLAAACQTLLSADTVFLADPAALEPPDPGVAKPLRAAYTELQAMAEACRNGQNAETLIRLDAFDRALARANEVLRPYALAP
ncbi:MAG TPA: hypothetical protein VF173_02610 [Thermoanaerobaculia bacterium]|nr:hypothetical protein [Thermoanaerobaculia bacterium]